MIELSDSTQNPKSSKMSSESLKSYPPQFRQPRIYQNPGSLPEGLGGEDSDDIPVVDLESMGMDLEKLREVCGDWGVFRLVNHGIPSELVRKLEEQANKVFELPFETKQEVLKSPITYFWGTAVLSQSSGAISRGAQNVDWVEGFNVTFSQLSQLEAQHATFLSFKAVLEEYGTHLARIARTMYEAMAKDLKLNPELSKSHLAESTGYVRVYRYPPCTEPDNEALGLVAHTDSTLFAIILQDLVGGLEVFKDNKWINVKPIPNTLIINLGDMLQAISDDIYKSVMHRVKVNQKVKRNSICYFVSPERDFVIESSNYRPFSYNDFRAQVQQDVKTVGNKVGLSRFELPKDKVAT